MRVPILFLGATLLVVSAGCGVKKPQYVVTATDVSNRVLGARSQRSAEPVERLRKSIGALRQRLAQEKKTPGQPPVVPPAPAPPVTGTSGFTAATPQATGTVGTTDGIPPDGAAPTGGTTPTAVPPAGIERRQAGSRPVWLAVVLVTAIGVLLLTRRRSLG